MNHEAKQSAYAARRAAVTGRQVEPTVHIRIVEANGAERVERFRSMAEAGAAYPDAIMLASVEKVGGFW